MRLLETFLKYGKKRHKIILLTISNANKIMFKGFINFIILKTIIGLIIITKPYKYKIKKKSINKLFATNKRIHFYIIKKHKNIINDMFKNRQNFKKEDNIENIKIRFFLLYLLFGEKALKNTRN